MSAAIRTKLVTFDGRGTLFQLSNTVGHFYGQAAEMYGLKLGTDSKSRLNAAFKTQYKLLSAEHRNFGSESGLSSQQWWNMMVKRTFSEAGFDSAKLDSLSSFLYKQFSTNQCWQAKENCAKSLVDLKALYPEIKLAVISNTDQRLDSILYQTGLRHFFDLVVDSYTAKCEKPNNRIFKLVLEKFSLEPKEVLHIGDDYELDYLGAKKAGCRSLLLVNAEQAKRSDIIEEDTINSLDGIKSKLEIEESNWD